MSEMVERVARAIAEIPNVFVRTNKMRDDKLFYEVGYVDGDVIDDDTVKIVGAFADSDAADVARDQVEGRLRARAAIEAMREPTEAMLASGWRYTVRSPQLAWGAMIDAALTPADAEPTAKARRE